MRSNYDDNIEVQPICTFHHQILISLIKRFKTFHLFLYNIVLNSKRQLWQTFFSSIVWIHLNHLLLFLNMFLNIYHNICSIKISVQSKYMPYYFFKKQHNIRRYPYNQFLVYSSLNHLKQMAHILSRHL